jgi:hypothetical protein
MSTGKKLFVALILVVLAADVVGFCILYYRLSLADRAWVSSVFFVIHLGALLVYALHTWLETKLDTSRLDSTIKRLDDFVKERSDVKS